MKIAVIGSSGSGKSTLAKKLADSLGIKHVELDALFHGPNWTPAQVEVFQEAVLKELESAEASSGWIVDGNYLGVLGNQILKQAHHVIWFNLPRRVVIYRLFKRTLLRGITRQALWNGNREDIRNLFSSNPEKNVVLWSWANHRDYQKMYSAEKKKSTENQIWLEISDAQSYQAALRFFSK